MSIRLAKIVELHPQHEILLATFDFSSREKEDFKAGKQVFSFPVLKTIGAVFIFRKLFANIRLSLPRYCTTIMGGVPVLSIPLELSP